ncbi:hypothetical protein HMPREF9419_0533 [Prevotella nigrescens ATCC 33563]|nr:hypothetical protein HMPREF9419_0533 [Prevotella nigrescens ATCC 33563]
MFIASNDTQQFATYRQVSIQNQTHALSCFCFFLSEEYPKKLGNTLA